MMIDAENKNEAKGWYLMANYKLCIGRYRRHRRHPHQLVMNQGIETEGAITEVTEEAAEIRKKESGIEEGEMTETGTEGTRTGTYDVDKLHSLCNRSRDRYMGRDRHRR